MQALTLADAINHQGGGGPLRIIRAVAIPPNRSMGGCWCVQVFHQGLQRRISFAHARDWPSIQQAWGGGSCGS